jgi:peptide methionine sulfoxide reductase MsrB/putative methionine-R-sulfoxide reductase with GAF domain
MGLEAPPMVERLDRAQAAGRLSGLESIVDVFKLAAAAGNDAGNDASLRAWKFPEPPKIAGACSRKMADEMFDALGAARASVPGLSEEAALSRLRALRAVCALVAEKTNAHWCGIYQVVQPSAGTDLGPFGGDNGAPNLLKLAYIGAPSRPYFPLTAAFAAGSNNSTVAMSGRAIVYHDILTLPTDSPYYTCDARVRSEACVPIFGPAGSDEVIGIMDVEAFEPDVFRPAEALGLVLAACAQLSNADLLRGPLAAAANAADGAAWEAHSCRMPAKLSTAEKEVLQRSITLADRSAYFALSTCPISHAAEQRMEQVSSLVTAEAYAKLFELGVYRCAKCGDTLYDHTSKFVGPCLWPSFRAPHHPTKSLHCIDVTPGAYNQYTCAVKELYCKKCTLFLGHAFEDGATTGDTHPEARWRHCVLSLSLQFGALD